MTVKADVHLTVEYTETSVENPDGRVSGDRIIQKLTDALRRANAGVTIRDATVGDWIASGD